LDNSRFEASKENPEIPKEYKMKVLDDFDLMKAF